MIKLNQRHVIFGSAALAGLALGAASSFAQDLTGLNDPPAIGEMAMGPDTAKVTVIEYASATCPHCADFYKTTFQDAEEGIYRHRQDPLRLPRVSAQRRGARRLHAGALRAQGKIFPADRHVLRHPAGSGCRIRSTGLYKIAQQAGFTQESFDACLKNEDGGQGHSGGARARPKASA